MKATSKSIVNSPVRVSEINELWLIIRRVLAVKKKIVNIPESTVYIQQVLPQSCKFI
jgi:hypothetical protein